METRRCGNCSHIIQNDASFCSNCGQKWVESTEPSFVPAPPETASENVSSVPMPTNLEPLQAQATPRECRSCRTVLEERFRFCPECGAPSAPAAPTMKIVVRPPYGAEQQVALDGSPITIGTSAGSSLQLEDPHVSKRHCQLVTNDAGEYQMEDVKSRNGTFVKLSEPIHIKTGDVFLVGTTLLTVESG